MTPQTFIFIGRSGCGKGTQAKLLEASLLEHDPSTPILYLETGVNFRDFITKDNFSSKLSSKIYKNAGLQPSFIAIYLWAKFLIEKFTGKQHLVIDGTPRYLDEAKALATAMDFYKLSPIVIYLNVSRKFSSDRMHERKRADDMKDGDIQKRLNWFDESVMPAVNFLKEDKRFEFIEIKGEQKIEEVHKDIVDKVFK